jgi:hypothetical protein
LISLVQDTELSKRFGLDRRNGFVRGGFVSPKRRGVSSCPRVCADGLPACACTLARFAARFLSLTAVVISLAEKGRLIWQRNSRTIPTHRQGYFLLECVQRPVRDALNAPARYGRLVTRGGLWPGGKQWPSRLRGMLGGMSGCETYLENHLACSAGTSSRSTRSPRLPLVHSM